MGLWSGFNTSIQPRESVAEKEMAIARQIALREEQKAKIAAGARDIARTAQSVGGAEARQAVGFETGRAVAAGMRQRPSFSREQEMLGEMFGQGEKIWGTNNNPVTINNDLNSSRSDPFDETSSMFGFGGQSEKSGLF